ncbi:beta-ketoacyl synthase N-terminal-like domain-containing protein [Vibrio mangrovi]|uniref:Beta-ketoacyl synthase N-terminal-like domain-containing protein n=1 Tax=Vibrio mangrovi TaxID=474394 RepID=A0A1Y6IZ86_9VIBR|nr:beta-ketoacyl synthase N-terminal-like domain-containing protein [Vibrio mangrovi]MDW6005410.1 beta-ketoacyl synthase N-terminal-like domain-containing protein [Vibrio mangrovi]SMS02150.1 Phthiocerol synthesis polyketide synthase type I PpsE [Vibrio mangrovi]
MDVDRNNGQTEDGSDTDIAIIGLGLKFPGADSEEAFWDNLISARESISRYNPDLSENSLFARPRKSTADLVGAAGIIDDANYFDAEFFGYSSKDAELSDPQQRLMLELAWQTLERSGYCAEKYPGRIGVYVGAANNTYGYYLRERLSELPDIGSGQLGVLNNTDYISSQISYQLNLNGPSYTVRTACSSSLASVHLACQALLDYECDMALAGGVAIRTPQQTAYQYLESGILAKDGHCKAFSSQATGTVFSHGAGLIAVKRLHDAIDDGDMILAVIKGSACNNDGRSKGSFTAPSVEGQVAVIQEALAHAGISPDKIDYIEAHGTGTDLGDLIELTALEKVFTQRNRRNTPVLIGSVKSNIGHLDAASGIAGLIKTVLALKYCHIPPSLYAENPREEFSRHNYPLRLASSPIPWIPQSGESRYAGVSSFGVGGTNVHVILQQAPEFPCSERAGQGRPFEEDTYHIRLSARNWRDLRERVLQLENYLTEHQNGSRDYSDTLTLNDLEGTLEQGRRDFSCRLGVTCHDCDSLILGLRKSRDLMTQSRLGQYSYQSESLHGNLADDKGEIFLGQVQDQPRLLLLFSGVHENPIACVKSFYTADQQCREEIEHCINIACREFSGFAELRRVLSTSDNVTGDDYWKYRDFSTQERLCTFMADYIFARMLIMRHSYPSECAGSGIGILAAACISGVIDIADACQLLVHWDDKEQLLTKLQDITFRTARYPLVSNQTGWRQTDEERISGTFWFSQLTHNIEEQAWRVVLSGYDVVDVVETGYEQQLTRYLSGQPYRINEATEIKRKMVGYSYRYWQRCQLRLWTRRPVLSSPCHQRFRRIVLPTYPFCRREYTISTLELPPKADKNHQESDSAPVNKIDDRSQWFYTPGWVRDSRQTAFPRMADTKENPVWLVLGANEKQCEAWKDALTRKDIRVVTVFSGETYRCYREDHYSINLSCQMDFRQLFTQLSLVGLAPHNVIHLLNLGDCNARSYGLYNPFYSVIWLAAVHAEHSVNSEGFFIVSHHAHLVHGTEQMAAERAMLSACIRVIPQEHHRLICRNIDIDDSESDILQPDTFELIYTEIIRDTDERIVAYRNGMRWTPTYQRLTPSMEQISLLPEHGGTYLILGGLGSFGLIAAAYLAGKGAATVVLAHRGTFPERCQWEGYLETTEHDDLTAARIRRLKAIEETGCQLELVQTELGKDASSLFQVFDKLVKQHGDITGVIHTAGVTGPETHFSAERATTERSEKIFSSKVDGIRHLMQALEHFRPGFCLLTSSLSPFLGGLGLSAYTAAHCFMDMSVLQNHLQQHLSWRNSRLPDDIPLAQKHTTVLRTINWEGWAPLGSVLSAHAAGKSISHYWMSEEEICACFDEVLKVQQPQQMIIATGDLESRMRQWQDFSDNSRRSFSDQNAEQQSIHLLQDEQRHDDIVSEYSLEDVCEILKGLVTELLGNEKVSETDSFFHLGGTSLTALQLLGRVQDIFQQRVSIEHFYNNSTIQELAQIIYFQFDQDKLHHIESILAEIEGLDAEEL